MLKKNIFITSFFTVIIFAIALKAINAFQENENRKRNILECQQERSKIIKGVVASAYYDDNINIKAFRINFSNGASYVTPIYIRSLNGAISTGDSLYKQPNSFKFFIFKANTHELKIFEDSSNCLNL